MNQPANSIVELRQGGKNRYVGWQGIPMNNGKIKRVLPWEVEV